MNHRRLKALMVDARLRGFPQSAIDQFKALAPRTRLAKVKAFEYWVDQCTNPSSSLYKTAPPGYWLNGVWYWNAEKQTLDVTNKPMRVLGVKLDGNENLYFGMEIGNGELDGQGESERSP